MLANGRDPYFPAWPDVVQLNAFSPDLRAAVVETLGAIAAQCDGVRCDMAMLMMNDVFERTWGERGRPAAGRRLLADRDPGDQASATPDFVFIAEAYWDLEWALQQQGFDYCYDKRLYDRLEHEGAESVRGHLTADPATRSGSSASSRTTTSRARPRRSRPGRQRAAAVATLTQTGARLVHEGQLEGRTVAAAGLPRPPPRRARRRRAAGLLRAAARRARATPSSATASGSSASAAGWEGNDTWRNLVAWGWRGDVPRKLVVVNLGDAPASGHVSLPWDDLRGPDVAARRRRHRRGLRAQRRRPARRAVRRARPLGLAPLRPRDLWRS